MEVMLQEFSLTTGVSYGIIRPGNVYGLESFTVGSSGVISAFYNSLCKGNASTVYGDGNTIRDYVHVSDVAKAIKLAIMIPDSVIWNIGTAEGASTIYVHNLLAQILDVQGASIEYISKRDTDVIVNVLSNDQVFLDTGWRPKIRLQEGIMDIVEKLNKNKLIAT